VNTISRLGIARPDSRNDRCRALTPASSDSTSWLTRRLLRAAFNAVPNGPGSEVSGRVSMG
jgi:hypothetical protein